MSKVKYIQKDTARNTNRILLPINKHSIKLNPGTNDFSVPKEIKKNVISDIKRNKNHYSNNDSLIDADELEEYVFNSKLLSNEILTEREKREKERERGDDIESHLNKNKTWSIRSESIRSESIRSDSVRSNRDKNNDKTFEKPREKHSEKPRDKISSQYSNLHLELEKENNDLKEEIESITKTNKELKKTTSDIKYELESYKKKTEKELERAIKKKKEKYINSENALKSKIEKLENELKRDEKERKDNERKEKENVTELGNCKKIIADLESRIHSLNVTNTNNLKKITELDSFLKSDKDNVRNEIERLKRQSAFDLETLEKKRVKEINDNLIIYRNSIGNISEQNSQLSLKLKKIDDINKIELLTLTQKYDRIINEKDKNIELLKSSFNSSVEQIHRDINSKIIVISNEYEAKLKDQKDSHENLLQDKEKSLIFMFQELINKIEADKVNQIEKQKSQFAEEMKLKESDITSLSINCKKYQDDNVQLFNTIHILQLENDNYKRERESVHEKANNDIEKLKESYTLLIRDLERKISEMSLEYSVNMKEKTDVISKLNENMNLMLKEINRSEMKLNEQEELISQFKSNEKKLNDIIKLNNFNDRERNSEIKLLKETISTRENELKKLEEISLLQSKSISEKTRMISLKDSEISRITNEIKNLNEKLLHSEREVKNITCNYNNILTEKDSCLSIISDQKTHNENLQKYNNEINKTLKEFNELSKKVLVQDNTIYSNKEKIKNYETSIKSLEDSNTELSRVNEKLNVKVSDFEKKIQFLNNRILSFEKTIKEQKQTNKEIVNIQEDKIQKDKIQEDKITEENLNKENLNKELQSLKCSFDILKKENIDLVNKCSNYTCISRNLELKEQDIKLLSSENIFIKDKLSKSENKIKELDTLISNYRISISTKNTTIEENIKEIDKLKLDIDKINNTNENKINEIIKNNKKDIAKIIAEKENELLEITQKYNKNLADLVTSEKNLKEAKEKLSDEIKSMKIIISSNNSEYTLKEEKFKETNISNIKHINNLEKCISEVSTRLENSINELKGKNAEITRIKEIVYEKEKINSEISSKVRNLENKISILIKEKETLVNSISSLETDIQNLKIKISDNVKEIKIKDSMIEKIEASIKSIPVNDISQIELLNLRKERDDLVMNNKKLVIENNYKTELYNKVYDNFTELNSKYDTLSGKYSLNITEKQHLELRIKSLNNYNIDLVSKIKNIERKNEDLQTQSMITSNIYNNNIKDIEKDSHERILESNKSLEYRYKVQIHKLSDIIKLRTNELKFSDDKYAKIMSERFTEYTMRIQSLTDEIVRKDNEIKDLLVKHENDIKDTVVKTESLFRTKMKLDPPTNYIRILKGKDQRIYVLQATLKTFRKDFQRKLVTLRTEINKLNLELKEKKEKEKDEEKCEEKCEERVERKEDVMENVILPLVN